MNTKKSTVQPQTLYLEPPPYLPWHFLELPKYFDDSEPPSYNSLPFFLKNTVTSHVVEMTDEEEDKQDTILLIEVLIFVCFILGTICIFVELHLCNVI